MAADTGKLATGDQRTGRTSEGGQQIAMDVEALVQVCAGDVLFLGQLAATFRKQTQEDLAGIERAKGEGNADGVRRSAHSLKGAASYLKAETLRRVAESMETAGRDAAMEGIDNAIAEAKREVERCLALIDERVGKETGKNVRATLL